MQFNFEKFNLKYDGYHHLRGNQLNRLSLPSYYFIPVTGKKMRQILSFLNSDINKSSLNK